MKKGQKKKRRARLEVTRLLKSESDSARLWRKLGTIDLSKAFRREADR